MYWFEPTGGVGPFLPECFPIFIWEPDNGNMFYSFSVQDDDRGVKAACFRAGGYPCDPETIDWEVRKEEIEFIWDYLAEHVPELGGRCLDAPACTPTPRICTSLSLRTRS